MRERKMVRKYLLCLVFSFDLFILVWLSEILRVIVLAVASGWSSGIAVLMTLSVLVFFGFVFGIIPIILLCMWFVNPLIVKNILTTVGLTEKSLDKKKDETEKGKT